MTLIKFDDRTWINPQAVTYVYLNMDGNAVIGCGDEHFDIHADINKVVEKINDALMVESVFVKAIEQARQALQFYADLKYSDKMGFPPEVQWIAEDAIKGIDELLKASK